MTQAIDPKRDLVQVWCDVGAENGDFCDETVKFRWSSRFEEGGSWLPSGWAERCYMVGPDQMSSDHLCPAHLAEARRDAETEGRREGENEGRARGGVC